MIYATRRGSTREVAVAVFGGADPGGKRSGPRRDLRDWAEIGNRTRKVLGLAREESGPRAPMDPPREDRRP